MSDYATRCNYCHRQVLNGVDHACYGIKLNRLRRAVREWIDSGDPGYPPQEVKELLEDEDE